MESYIPVRVRAKLWAKKMLPSRPFESLRRAWIATGAKFVGDSQLVDRYTQLFLSKYPKVVQAGPFKGMNYVDNAVGSAYLNKLIGSYEAVLHPFIESIRGTHFDTVIDIGSAEGYYLTGFGQMFPSATLVGFETETRGQELSKELYRLNCLKNELIIRGTATNASVAPYIKGKTFLICDCEGGEVDILMPDTYPEFKNVDTGLIELHDFLRPGIKEALTSLFSPTHTISFIQFALADPAAFPFLAQVQDKKDLYELRRERGCQEQEWMLLKKK